MKVWVDAQLSPAIARWMKSQFTVEASPVRDLHLHTAKDRDIFMAARKAGAVIMSKDSDFVRLLEVNGKPSQIVWLTCGNTSNAHLQKILLEAWPKASSMLLSGEPLVEISDSTT